MTILSDFTTEVARELDVLRVKEGRWPIDPQRWPDFVRLLIAIDRGTVPVLVDTRAKLEQIALRDESFQDRCKAMLPHLIRLLPMGSMQ